MKLLRSEYFKLVLLVVGFILIFVFPPILLLYAFIGAFMHSPVGKSVKPDVPTTHSEPVTIPEPKHSDYIPAAGVGNRFMRKEDKAAYLKSPEWKELKQYCLNRANHTCEVPGCNNPFSLDLHHLTYENLGAEDPSQLVILCRACHQAQHDHYGLKRETDYIPIIIRPSLQP